MARKNPHIGSSFESWLDEAGIREEVTAAAIKAVIARQLASEMKKKKITKQRMAELMKTSRAQVDRLLDPDNGSATIESLQRAAKIVGESCGCSWCRHHGSKFDGWGSCDVEYPLPTPDTERVVAVRRFDAERDGTETPDRSIRAAGSSAANGVGVQSAHGIAAMGSKL